MVNTAGSRNYMHVRYIFVPPFILKILPRFPEILRASPICREGVSHNKSPSGAIAQGMSEIKAWHKAGGNGTTSLRDVSAGNRLSRSRPAAHLATTGKKKR